MTKSGLLIFSTMLFLVSLIFRSVWLDKSPYSLNWDEASLGYNAYSIATNGKDEWGNLYPINIRSFNDYKPALYAYTTIPFIKIFGLNQSTVRLPSAVFGSLSIVAFFLILNLFTNRPMVSFIFSLLISFEPWRIHFSRIALETNVSMALFSWGVYFLLRWFLGNKRKLNFLAGFLFMAGAAYSYHSARLAFPVLMVLLTTDPLRRFIELKKRFFVSSDLFRRLFLICFLTMLVLAPMMVSGKSIGALQRFRQENIFSRYYPFSPKELYKEGLMEWLRINPAYYLMEYLAGHILSYVSVANFGSTAYHWIRKSVQYTPDFSLLGFWEYIMLLPGIIYVLKRLGTKKFRFLIYWFLAGVLPAALTWNWFHHLRSLNMVPVVELAVVLATFSFLENKRLIIKILFTVFVLWQLAFVVNSEYVYSIWENNGEFQPGGYRQGLKIIMPILNNYDRVIIDSPQAQNYIFMLFYLRYNPFYIQKLANYRELIGSKDGNLDFDFGKFEFRKINYVEDKYLRKTILWMQDNTAREEIYSVPYSTLYYLPSAISKYNSGMLVTLD